MMLGNLTIGQIEKRIGIAFPEETKQFMEKTHQPEANNIAFGKWHCFDIPFHLVCGDVGTATIIYNSVKDRSDEIKERLEFSVNTGNK